MFGVLDGGVRVCEAFAVVRGVQSRFQELNPESLRPLGSSVEVLHRAVVLFGNNLDWESEELVTSFDLVKDRSFPSVFPVFVVADFTGKACLPDVLQTTKLVTENVNDTGFVFVDIISNVGDPKLFTSFADLLLVLGKEKPFSPGSSV